MQTQKFHIGDVLTVTTGRLLSQTGMDGLYTILKYLLGDSAYTNQIPRALDVCKGHVLAKYPALGAETGLGATPENKEEWFALRANVYGEWFELTPLPVGAFQHGNAAAELAEQIGADRVFVTKTN